MAAIRSAVIGGGFIGQVHARSVLANGEDLVTILNSHPSTTAARVAEFRAERVYEDFEAILADPTIDLIHICTPNFLHYEQALAAILAGKHVICEKPLATSVEQAQILVNAAADAGVVAAVPFVYRFYASVRDAKARISNGELGDLNLLHGHYLQDWLLSDVDNNWRVDPKLGGASRAFGDIGVHWCDLIEFITQDRIKRVSAQTSIAHATRSESGETSKVSTEDIVSFMFETESGVVGNAVVSQVSAGRPNELLVNIDGSKSSISFNQMLPDSLWLGSRTQTTRVWRGSEGMSNAAQAYSNIPSGHPQGYQDSFNSFYRDVAATIRGESVTGLPTFADGLRAARLTDAVLKSSENKTWMEVENEARIPKRMSA